MVKDGAIVGEGWTQPPGKAHAEIVALDQAGPRARGTSLFVTLEPCCYYGRTPPCTKAIVEAGVREVYVGLIDRNPLVNGKGLRELREAGLRVQVLGRSRRLTEMVQAHTKFVTTGLPFITAKFAMTLDGKIASKGGDSKWITGEKARRFVHELRMTSDAVMVGANTILQDDPQLTARDGNDEPLERQPLRIIVDSGLRTPADARVFREPGKNLIFTTEQANARAFNPGSTEIVKAPSKDGRVDLSYVALELGRRGVTSLLVEGGSETIGSLFDLRLIDKVVAFIAPVLVGGNAAPSPIGGEGVESIADAVHVATSKIRRIGGDVAIIGYCKSSDVHWHSRRDRHD